MRIRKYELPIRVGGSEFTHYATFCGERMEFSQEYLNQIGEKEAARRFRKIVIENIPYKLIPRWIRAIRMKREIRKIKKLLE